MTFLKRWAISKKELERFTVIDFSTITSLFLLYIFEFQKIIRTLKNIFDLLKILPSNILNFPLYHIWSLNYKHHKDLVVYFTFVSLFVNNLSNDLKNAKIKQKSILEKKASFFQEFNQTFNNKNWRQPCNNCIQL